jgi:hypothetical protein
MRGILDVQYTSFRSGLSWSRSQYVEVDLNALVLVNPFDDNPLR